MRKIFAFCLVAALLLSCVGGSQAVDIVSGSSIVKIGEDIHISAGTSVNSAVAIRGNIYVRGTVDEDVVAVLGDVRLYPTARIGKDAVSVGGRVIKDPAAMVGGDIVDISIGRRARGMIRNLVPYVGVMPVVGFVVFRILLLLGFIGLAALLISFLTRHVGVIAARIEKSWWKALLWGILGVILIVPAMVFLTISIIGIPLIFVLIIFVSIAMVMGFVAVADIVGKRIIRVAKKKKQSIFIEAILGLIILFLVDLIPIIGGIVRAAALLMGFGASLTTKLGFEEK